MSTEDFSFPTNNFPCTIDSPPLWRLTSATSSDSSIHEETSKQGLENEEEEDDDDDYKSINFGQRKSFSCVEEKIRYDESSKKKEEEKMDMLWEDFNEELMPRNKSYKSDDSDYHHKLSKGEIFELGCVPPDLKFNRTSNSLLSARNNKPPGIIELLKVFKKIFMLHNTHHQRSKS